VLALSLGLAACSTDDSATQGGGDHGDVAGTMGTVGGATSTAGAMGTVGGTGGQSVGGSGVDGGTGGTAGGSPSAGTGPQGGTWGGGGAAGLGGAGAGGTSTYSPCPADGTPCKILPLGDSITRGHKSSDDAGYRSQLFKLIIAANQKAMFTGSLTNGPTQVSGRPFPRTHEGHAGWTIDPGYNPNPAYGGISSLIPSPALNSDPHIVLLHIGTNDLFARDTANMSTRLEVLIDDVAQSAPTALIVLAQITPLGSPSPALTTYNGKIPGIIQSHVAKGQHIIGVDMSKLPITELSDGTHPNDQGYAHMANIWYAAIKDLLPK